MTNVVRINGSIVRIGRGLMSYTPQEPEPIVLGYPMYIYGMMTSDILTIEGTGQYNIIDDGGTTIDDTLPNQIPYTFIDTPSDPITVLGNDITTLNLYEQSNVYDLIVSANTNLEVLNIYYTSISNIDLNNNINLTELTIGEQSFTDLILSNCTMLSTFNVDDTVYISGTLDLSNTLVTTFNTNNISFN